MHIDHHPLTSEFPEHREAIHNLKLADAHFCRLAGEFESIDKAVTRAENGDEHLGDLALEVLKKQRLAIKDQLWSMLQKGVTA
ncbi:YdcH family protein [Chitinimonas sp. BJB300]|uniref:YdcH family protein n=1 Tax=Chitinimonas sp. BJB300 TaxID=1559339 RepID=UPI000C0D0666|nr:YdcH family protein [Chitinimonas sp. BJB300]PHV10735.1 GTP-binding protein [Chitinimonas sp. BJB300]TSJ91237.1 DUF465 domain-containing protein [Chitinimonas sp. BJB300]